MRWVKYAGTLYILIASIAGIFHYFNYRVECIQKEGFFSVFTGTCKATTFNYMFKLPPGMLESQLRGLLWPYDLVTSSDDTNTSPQEDFETGLELIAIAVKNKDHDVIKMVRQLAENIVARENQDTGKIIDEDTIAGSAQIEGRTIVITSIVRNTVNFEFYKEKQQIFSKFTRESICRDSESQPRRVVEILFAGGYDFKIIYIDKATSQKLVVPIKTCDDE